VPGYTGSPLLQKLLCIFISSTTVDDMTLGISFWTTTGGMNMKPSKVCPKVQGLADGKVGKVLALKYKRFSLRC